MANGGGEESKKLKLYSYWRSSCSCRVRIALNLKGLDYEYITVNLLTGEQKSPEFLKLNPIGCVRFSLMYLEDKYPQHPLLPQDLQKKALNYQVASRDKKTVCRVRKLMSRRVLAWNDLSNMLFLSMDTKQEQAMAANLVSASIQPYQNLPIIGYIKEKLGPDEMLAWVQHHIGKGFAALEKLLESYAGKYATGDDAFLADLFLAPQIDGAVRRFNIDMNEFPILSKISELYKEHPAFQDAMPGKQPDAPPEARD